MVNLKLLKNLRIKKGLSQKQMSEKLGFKNSANYSKYESGKYELTASMISELSNIFEVPVDHFFK